MPLDPLARTILDRMYATSPFSPSMTPIEVRKMVRERLATLPPPEAIGRVEDRPIPRLDGAEMLVRIYRPRGEGPWPVLVYFHGGGFVVGDLDGHDGSCRALTNAVPCVVVSVDYRLAPEHPFPSAPEDASAATRWVAEHAASFGGDPTRIAVGGQSAGGNLAAVVPLMARDRGGPPLVFQLLVYPMADHSFETPSYRENAEGYWLTRERMQWYWGHYLARPEDGAHPYASPLRATDLRGLPPALVLTAEYDPLRDEGEAYAARLREAGVPVAHTRYEGQIHGFFAWLTAEDGRNQAMEESTEALRAAFGMGR